MIDPALNCARRRLPRLRLLHSRRLSVRPLLWARRILALDTVLVAAMVAACLALVGLDGWRTWQARQLALAGNAAESANLARSLAQHAHSIIQSIDVALLAMQEQLSSEPNGPALRTRLRRLMEIQVAHLPALHSLFIFDTNADPLVSSLPPGFPAQGIGDRDYFKVLRDRRIDGPLVSGPYRSKSDGNWVLSISRRLEKPDGSFDGVVVATVQVSTINDFYATFDKGPQGVVALLTLDGKMVVCHPDLQLAVGAGRHLNEVFSTRLPQEPVGSFAYTSTLDHVERLASYRKVKDYPLVVVVAPAMDEVLAKWRDDALIHLAVSLAVAVALGATGFALSRQVRRRQGAEKRLAALNRVLSVQANTDGLTGLANRRRFDEALAQQWRRMARHRAPLSLLLIDLDHFKLFNDTYGHPAGDRCLCAAARAIRSLTQRLDETAARYGGEEFALLLPKTGNAPAVHLAERIRVAIHALGIAHGSNRPTGVMTASVGVATLLPHVDWSSGGEGLLLQADAALYQAKLRGRNRVATAPEGPEPEMAEHDTPMAAFTLS